MQVKRCPQWQLIDAVEWEASRNMLHKNINVSLCLIDKTPSFLFTDEEKNHHVWLEMCDHKDRFLIGFAPKKEVTHVGMNIYVTDPGSMCDKQYVTSESINIARIAHVILQYLIDGRYTA
jgi:hypothetical protein